MGKRKVDINGQPLQSITIGKVKQPKFVGFKVFLLIGLFCAFVFYLPDLLPIIDKYLVQYGLKAPEVDPSSKPNKPEEKPENPDGPGEDEIVTYAFGETTEIDLTSDYKIKVSNVSNVDNKLTFNINTAESGISLDELNLYFVTYNEDDTIIQYIYLKGLPTKDAPVNYSFDIDPATRFNVKKVTEDDYPIYNVETDSEGLTKVSCAKDEGKYNYVFKNNKLTKVEYVVTIAKSDPKYNEVYATCSELYKNYRDTLGVTVSLSTSDDLRFMFTVDTNKVTAALPNKEFYNKDATVNKVIFELSSQFYNCN